MHDEAFRVGPWMVHPDANEIVDGTSRVRLEPKAMAMLAALARRNGAIVSRDDLLREVWPGTYIAEGGLFRVLSQLRHALGDDARSPKFIETIPKRGYRLVAPVARAVTPVPVPPPATERRQSGWRLALIAGSLPLLLLLVALVGLGRRVPSPSAKAPAADAPVPESFAVGQVWEHRADCAAYARARSAYEAAIVESPGYGAAYTNLVDSYLASAVIGCVPPEQARARVEALLAAAPRGSGDTSLARRHASARLWFGGDREEARRRFEAIASVPDVSRAALLLALDRPADAVEEAWRAWRDAPAALGENFTVAVILLLADRPGEARARFDATLDLYPGFPPAVSLRALALLEAGERDGALRAAREAAAGLRPPLDRFSSVPALVLARLGHGGEATAFAERWTRLAREASWVAATAHALAAQSTGDEAAAHQWLRRAEAEGDPWLLLARHDPLISDLVDRLDR